MRRFDPGARLRNIYIDLERLSLEAGSLLAPLKTTPEIATLCDLGYKPLFECIREPYTDRSQWTSIGALLLELVAETELHLTVRGIRLAFGRHLSKGATGWVGIRRIEIRMVGEVESFSSKGDHMIFQCRNHMDILLQCNVPALEAR
jgi:hypothetical protein